MSLEPSFGSVGQNDSISDSHSIPCLPCLKKPVFHFEAAVFLPWASPPPFRPKARLIWTGLRPCRKPNPSRSSIFPAADFAGSKVEHDGHPHRGDHRRRGGPH